jgi:hypothetical protein
VGFHCGSVRITTDAVLDVESDATRFDLAHENRRLALRCELIDEGLALDGSHSARNHAEDEVPEHGLDCRDHVLEVGEDHDFPAVRRSLLGDVDQARQLRRPRRGAGGVRSPTHRHEASVRDGLTVSGEVVARELDPRFGFDPRREFVEHVALVAAEIDRGHGATERVSARKAIHGSNAVCHRRLQVTDKRAELLDAVLHGRAGQVQRSFRPAYPLLHDLGALGGRVLHVVRFVDDQHRDRDVDRGQRLQGVIRHGDTAAALPDRRCAVALGAVQAERREARVTADLVRPVDEHARRANDQEMRGAFTRQMANRGQRLDRLA